MLREILFHSTERLTHSADSILDIVLKRNKTYTFLWENIGLMEGNWECVTYSWTGSAYVVPSNITKAGVLAMTRSLAVKWAKYNIRFNAIARVEISLQKELGKLLPGFSRKI